jgi:methyl-accepting chemotaxis protein
MKLRKKLIVIFVLISLIPFLAGTGIIFFASNYAVRSDARGFLSEHSDSIAREVQAFFARKTGLVESVAFFPGIADMAWPELQAALAPLIENFSRTEYIRTYLRANSDGSYYRSDSPGNPACGGLMTVDNKNPGAEAVLLDDRDYFQFLVQNNRDNERRSRVSNPIISKSAGQKMIVLGTTLINTAGETTGLIGFYVDWNTLAGMLDAITTEIRGHFGEQAVFLILSENGVILSHREYDPGQDTYTERALNVDGDYNKGDLDESFRQAAMELKTGASASFHDEASGLRYFMAGSPVPGTGYRIALALPEQALYETVFTMEKIILSVFAATLAAVFIIAVLLSYRIIKPIVTVTLSLKDISDGEGDLTKTVAGNSKDEIGDLARYFNATLGKIKNLVITIKTQAAALSGVGNELAGNMTETAAAISAITANIRNIKGQIVSQSSSITETNATMEQITVNIDKLSGHVENQNSSVAQSTAAIEEMIANINSVTQTLIKNGGNVKDLAGASRAGCEGLREVAADIQEIARASTGILEINTVMEDIASQTSLLSMNAAIEAAHAGDAGKGFAVVADEIRKLAENSGEQSKTISLALRKIKNSIDKITASTGSVFGKFEAIERSVQIVSEQEDRIRGAMEEQSAGSRQVLEAIRLLNQATEMVKNGSEEMLAGSRQVIQESRNLDTATREITSGMNEMAAGADQINVAVNQVNAISGENRSSIEVLVHEMSRFKVE